MATVRVFNEVNSTYYNVYFDLKQTYLSDGDGTQVVYLLARTDIKRNNGTTILPFKIFDLTDLPPDGDPTPVTDFSGLCKRYVKYFQTEAALTMSSSSSSSEGFSSSSSSSSEGKSSSSSSSSEGKSSSSSSSSSSSEGVSSSSSSSSSSLDVRYVLSLFSDGADGTYEWSTETSDGKKVFTVGGVDSATLDALMMYSNTGTWTIAKSSGVTLTPKTSAPYFAGVGDYPELVTWSNLYGSNTVGTVIKVNV